MLWLRRWIPKRNLGWFWFARAGRHFNRNRCSWYRSTFMQFAPYSIFNLYFPSEIISPVRVCLCWCLTTRLTLRCRCVRWPATQRAQKADRYGHPWPPPLPSPFNPYPRPHGALSRVTICTFVALEWGRHLKVKGFRVPMDLWTGVRDRYLWEGPETPNSPRGFGNKWSH